MVFPRLSKRTPLRLYDWPDDIFGVLKQAGIAQAGYVPMAVMPADRERTHAPIRKFMRSRRHSEPTCDLSHAHTLFQELHGAKAPPIQRLPPICGVSFPTVSPRFIIYAKVNKFSLAINLLRDCVSVT